MTEVSRRQLLKIGGATALAAGLPAGWVGGVYAADGPETPKVRIGIIALPDCSSIVMAHELGLFKRYGIESTISKEASRDCRTIERGEPLRDSKNHAFAARARRDVAADRAARPGLGRSEGGGWARAHERGRPAEWARVPPAGRGGDLQARPRRTAAIAG